MGLWGNFLSNGCFKKRCGDSTPPPFPLGANMAKGGVLVFGKGRCEHRILGGVGACARDSLNLGWVEKSCISEEEDYCWFVYASK